MASSSFPSSSSSSSSVPPRGGWAYDVFLSFRGEDTRNNFVDHLYTALDRSGLIVFKDDKMLRVGKEISPELMKSIEESTCTVVVFSKNYANSSWCLAELAKVMECHSNQNGRLVIPVFYHVDPSDVRGQKGDFLAAFQQHEEKFKEEMDRVNKWRQVLTAAAKLSGHHISDKEAEAAFIAEIVRQIHGNIPPRGMEKNQIGIKSHINKLKSLLDLEATEKVLMIGIWGMGGIGKTTIALALFREIHYKFDGCSFVDDVRENVSDKKVFLLQKKIVKQIAHYEPDITHEDIGSEMIRKILREKKILLVLDDVDDAKQLEVLGATLEWFGKGSRIIITTRDRGFLTDACEVYSLDSFRKEHAVELFSWHAFRKNSPPEGYTELSNRAISYTHGLPLALKVLGCFFYGKRDEHEWEIYLNRLAKAKNNGSLETPLTHKKKGVMETMKISFDGLDDNEKEIFLDIVCFFKGEGQEYVTEILDCSGLEPIIGVRALIKKSLITVSRGCIHMHDVLEEMGLGIVRESYPNTRLRRSKELRCLEQKNNLESVTGIMQRHDSYNDEEVRFSGDVFEKMNNIRLLKTWGYFTSCEPTTFPDKLGWLRWSEYPFSSLPVANMRKLVGLEMNQGEINHLWTGCEPMPNLKFIVLEYMRNLKSLPDVLGVLNVKRLVVRDCGYLVEIHKSLGTLKKLAYLELRNCKNVLHLPSMEEMPLLETIDLTGCCGLERFPEVSSSMVKLSTIHLNKCSNLKNIPNSICELKNLKILHLQDCGKLQDLPEELGSIGKLEELLLGFKKNTFTGSIGLEDSINLHALTKLCCLRKLDLSWRQMEEQDFPKNFHEFSSLEELHLSGNCKLVRLPASISRLSSLKHLELNYCRQLQSIQGLPSGIQVLMANTCRALEEIEDLSNKYASLHSIFLPGWLIAHQNHENKAYRDEMLQPSFIKKCIAVDGKLNIWIPAIDLPSWFKKQFHDGYDISDKYYSRYEIALKLPPQRHTSIMGFVVYVDFNRGYSNPIFYHIVEDSGISASPTDRIELPNEVEDTASMVYIPESVFWGQMNDEFGKGDWSLLVESGRSVTIIVETSLKVKSCGAYIVYKEDLESIQQIKTPIPDYGDSDFGKFYVFCGGDFLYSVKFRLGSIG